ATRSISESETYRSEQSSDNEDEPFSKTNKMSVLIKRLETLEKLQAAYNKVKNQKLKLILDDTDNDPVPIKKPNEAIYVNIPKFFKIDKPIYNSYQESLRLMIMAKYEKNISEFRQIPKSKKSEIIKRMNDSIDYNQPLEVTRTSSPQNNSDILDISSTTEVSEIPSKKS
ncbi:23314_t:CDS:2, partial [Gigaspora rosea]